MIEVACLTFIVASISAALIICFQKWGWFEWLEIHWKPICRFCLGFWLCVLMAAISFCFNQNLFYIAIPFAGASICRKLIE
jgi:hypothetical protein